MALRGELVLRPGRRLKVTEIRLDTFIAASAKACFDLSLSIDAHIGSMHRSGEQAVAGVISGVIGPGEEVTWEARHFGARFRMTTRITEHQAPDAFVDEQVEGPFASWWHRHDFEPVDGGTRMVDTVRYEVPYGGLGRLGDSAMLRRYMTRLLEQRNAYLKAYLEAR